jgi:hypothetical protein
MLMSPQGIYDSLIRDEDHAVIDAAMEKDLVFIPSIVLHKADGQR